MDALTHRQNPYLRIKGDSLTSAGSTGMCAIFYKPSPTSPACSIFKDCHWQPEENSKTTNQTLPLPLLYLQSTHKTNERSQRCSPAKRGHMRPDPESERDWSGDERFLESMQTVMALCGRWSGGGCVCRVEWNWLYATMSCENFAIGYLKRRDNTMRTEDKATISAARSREVSSAWMSVWPAARSGLSWSVLVHSRGLHPNATSTRSKNLHGQGAAAGCGAWRRGLGRRTGF